MLLNLTTTQLGYADVAVVFSLPHGLVEFVAVFHGNKLEVEILVCGVFRINITRPLVGCLFDAGNAAINMPVAQYGMSSAEYQTFASTQLRCPDLESQHCRVRTTVCLTRSASVDALREGRAVEVRVFWNVNPRVVGGILRNALLTDGYAMSVGSPFVVNDFVALLLSVVIVEILGTVRLKAVGELPLPVAALRHALREDGAVSLTYVDVEVVAKLGSVCYVEIEEHDS